MGWLDLLRQVARRSIDGPPVADEHIQELAREIETHWRRYLMNSVRILEAKGQLSQWCNHLAQLHQETHADALRQGLSQSEGDDVARRCWQVDSDTAEKLLTTSQWESAPAP